MAKASWVVPSIRKSQRILYWRSEYRYTENIFDSNYLITVLSMAVKLCLVFVKCKSLMSVLLHHWWPDILCHWIVIQVDLTLIPHNELFPLIPIHTVCAPNTANIPGLVFFLAGDLFPAQLPVDTVAGVCWGSSCDLFTWIAAVLGAQVSVQPWFTTSTLQIHHRLFEIKPRHEHCRHTWGVLL